MRRQVNTHEIDLVQRHEQPVELELNALDLPGLLVAGRPMSRKFRVFERGLQQQEDSPAQKNEMRAKYFV